MVYDKPITILALPDDVGVPLQGTLEPVFTAYCGEMTVYHTRYWESVQAGSRIDTMVEIPLRRPVDAGMFALYKEHIYSVEQAQFGEDEDGLPVTWLSLKRSEEQYDIAGVR